MSVQVFSRLGTWSMLEELSISTFSKKYKAHQGFSSIDEYLKYSFYPYVLHIFLVFFLC